MGAITVSGLHLHALVKYDDDHFVTAVKAAAPSLVKFASELLHAGLMRHAVRQMGGVLSGVCVE